MIHVLEVNDETPELLVNEDLIIEMGEEKVSWERTGSGV